MRTAEVLPPVGRLTQDGKPELGEPNPTGGRVSGGQTEPVFQGRQEERQTEARQPDALIFRVISGVYRSGLIAD